MNTIKTAILMALMMMLLVILGAVIGGKGGAMLMFVISLAMNFFSYWFSDSIVLKMYGARPLTEHEAPELYRLVADLAARAGLPMPKVCLIDRIRDAERLCDGAQSLARRRRRHARHRRRPEP
mgnify:CR=1 FL=1